MQIGDFTIQNFQGFYGNFNQGTLDLISDYRIKKTEQAIYIPNFITINQPSLNKIQICKMSKETCIFYFKVLNLWEWRY